MLNGKHINTEACNPVPASEEAAEGKLFTVSAIIPYLPSMKEYLREQAPDCTQAQTFMAGLVKIDFDADDNIYDISGRKVSRPVKGIYIRGGKKIAVK